MPRADATAPLMDVEQSVEVSSHTGGLPAVQAQSVLSAGSAVPAYAVLSTPDQVVITAGIGPVSPEPGVVVPIAPAVVACDCSPRCKSIVVHQRLVERARHNGATLRQQRAADADKRKRERWLVNVFVLLGYVGWYTSQGDIYCSECTDPIFQTCPGLEGCPAPTHTCDGCSPMVDGHCAGVDGQPWPPTSNDGDPVTNPYMCFIQSPGVTCAAIFIGGFINVSSRDLHDRLRLRAGPSDCLCGVPIVLLVYMLLSDLAPGRILGQLGGHRARRHRQPWCMVHLRRNL